MKKRQAGGRGTRRGRVPAILAVTMAGLTGCLGGPDMSDRADEIGAALSPLSGVEAVETIYQKGFDSGMKLGFRVTMAAGAADGEASDVAATLQNEIGDDFKRYNHELALIMPSLTIRVDDRANSDALAQRTPRLLDLAPTLNATHLIWKEQSDDVDFDTSLEVEGPQADPYDTLDAVRAQFGSDEMTLRMRQPDDTKWYVDFPYSDRAQAELNSKFGPILPMTDQISIADDQVTQQSVTIPEGPNELGRLRGIIELIDSTASEPWGFSWSVGQKGEPQPGPRTGGMVSVGGCDYDRMSEYEKDPAGHMTQNAVAVQEQLRDTYDSCP